MKGYLLLVCFISGIISISNSYSQTHSKFDKRKAIEWLNNKMNEAKDVNIKDLEKTFHYPHPAFSSCNFHNKIDEAKIEVNYKAEFETQVIYTFEYDVPLNTLNPYSLRINVQEDKFYFDVYTTNSKPLITEYGYKPGEMKEKITSNSYIRIGPFKTETDGFEERVKGVLFKLIQSCGGKKDSF